MIGRRRHLLGVSLALMAIVGALAAAWPLRGSEDVASRDTSPATLPRLQGSDDVRRESSPAPSPRPIQRLPGGWTDLPAPPEVRSSAATAWTGEKVIVWGGYVFTGSGDKPAQADGFAFDAREGRWRQMVPSPLEPRAYTAAAWTGEEVLIWGGSDGRQERLFGDGAAYDPQTDTWRRLPKAPINARAPLSVWTGREFIVWGTAIRHPDPPRDGAAYDPKIDSWRRIAPSPIELTDATAVWTGQEMIVFGAALRGGNVPATKSAVGAAYDPGGDTWRRLPSSDLSPQASTAAWDGRELIAWDYLNESSAYSPRRDAWRHLPRVPLTGGRCLPASVAIRRVIFGQYCGHLALYDPAAGSWREVSRRDLLGWELELVSADRFVLLLGRRVEDGEQRMLAYRPVR